eukprot:9258043-Pyramimonas_sp.AAC.1
MNHEFEQGHKSWRGEKLDAPSGCHLPLTAPREQRLRQAAAHPARAEGRVQSVAISLEKAFDSGH